MFWILYLHENATDESHKQSRGALAFGHSLILDGCIAIYHKVLASIRRSKHWCRSELVLEGLETFLTFIRPLKFDAFVKQMSQRLGNLGEILDEWRQ